MGYLLKLFCLLNIVIIIFSNVISSVSIAGGSGWSGHFNGNNYLLINTNCQHNKNAYRSNCKSIPSSILNSFTFQLYLYPQFNSLTTSNISLLSIPK
eukprot:183369_1